MKYKYFLLPIAGMIMLAAIIVSCSKQEQTEPVGSSPEIYQSNADVQIENKIKAFKSKLEFLRENPTFKSGETIAVDSAVWYIEAASNQTYADAGTSYVELVIDSFNIEIATANNEVQLNDLLTAYDEMIDGLSESYDAIPDENKQLVVNDVSLKSQDEGTATFGVTAGFGVEGDDGTSGIFDHAWYYGELLSDCNFNYPGTDAAEKIEDKIIARKGTPSPNTYYTDEEPVFFLATEFPNTEDLFPWDNMYDYYMFCCMDDYANIWPNVHTCVSVDEMNFYLLGTEYVLNHDKPQFARPPGKSLITVDLIGNAIYGDEGTEYMHYGTAQYGIPHQGSDPRSDL